MPSTDDRPQLSIFISHDWEDTVLYERAARLLDNRLTGAWQDLSVPRSRAIAIAETKKAAWMARQSVVEDERYSLLSRQRDLQQDLERVSALDSIGGKDTILRIILQAQREELKRWIDVLPNARARERYAEQPLAALNATEQALGSRSLLERSVTDASRILSNEVTAVTASIASVDRVLESIGRERKLFEGEEELLELPASSFALQKMPLHKSLTVDRMLAEQLSALVSQCDVVLLLIGELGMYKPWIHFELTLAVRHRRPIVAVPIGCRHEVSTGLLKDLASFGAAVTDWEDMTRIIRKCIRFSVDDADA